MNKFQPKKTKFKRLHKGRVKAQTYKKTNTNLIFGVWGLQLLKTVKLTGNQIEAARRMMSRSLKKNTRLLWIRGLTDIPVTQKPKDMRMGKGKGPVQFWIMRIPAGKILFEISKLNSITAKHILKLAAKKLPCPTRIIYKKTYIEPKINKKLM